MVVAVPVAGELHFFPFHTDFRVSLGTPVFFLFLLWVRSVPPVVSGLLVGASVAAFRIGLEWTLAPRGDWGDALRHHEPAFLYYATYGLAFAAFRLNRYRHRPIALGALGVAVELAASAAELLLRRSAADGLTQAATWNQIGLLAVFRSFFVVGFFNLVQLKQTRAAEERQRKEKETMLMLVTGLYEETIHLNKTLRSAERIAQDCYGLYQSLKGETPVPRERLAQQALRIAGEVHDIKKDNQRIYAGLSGLIAHDGDYMPLAELAGIVRRSNEKYALSLGKKIGIGLRTEGDLPSCHAYATLSLLNNLVANAVEAIPESGHIAIEARREDDTIVLEVADDGPGVTPKHRDNVFVPGFTTKYDSTGKASTGIGLAYVKQEAERMSGTVRYRPGSGGTGAVFTVALPASRIGKEE
ncbi:sensor histidine kinase [Paenibacillus flagellatus]|uniref:histidine kinase n=2 Tax=Paenibacillus flagellatus TaxID=2211139 RepID=A0A2V5KDG9_9BACL|nr:sensor histidine kinase [Paenibacillus flagellatus]